MKVKKYKCARSSPAAVFYRSLVCRCGMEVKTRISKARRLSGRKCKADTSRAAPSSDKRFDSYWLPASKNQIQASGFYLFRCQYHFHASLTCNVERGLPAPPAGLNWDCMLLLPPCTGPQRPARSSLSRASSRFFHLSF